MKFGNSDWRKNTGDALLQQNEKAYFESKGQKVTRVWGECHNEEFHNLLSSRYAITVIKTKATN
jgi:hypothetical protein